jgi:hypothetical protein
MLDLIKKGTILLAALALVALVGCDGDAGGEELFPNTPSTSPSPFPSPSTLPSPTPPTLPATPPATSGPPSARCIEGWRTPTAGSSLAQHPIAVIRRTVRLPDDPVVVDMRFFEGPESPPSDKGYLLNVERWYVKLYSPSDLRFQGRFLVESREFGDGVVAVAPFDTDGFRSPDWSGFQWNGGDRVARAYAGLPGRWRGIRYDFVNGGAGLDIPGLPAQVRGCLDTA